MHLEDELGRFFKQCFHLLTLVKTASISLLYLTRRLLFLSNAR